LILSAKRNGVKEKQEYILRLLLTGLLKISNPVFSTKKGTTFSVYPKITSCSTCVHRKRSAIQAPRFLSGGVNSKRKMRREKGPVVNVRDK